MATMAGRYCCSSNSPSVLPPQRQPALGLPLQLQGTGGRGRGLRRPSLRAVASAAAEPMKAATDAEFFQPADSRPIMLFDGVCNLCNGGVRFVREHDPGRSIRYIPLQSDSGRKLLRRSGRSPDDISSVVLVEKDRYIPLQSDSGRKLLRRSGRSPDDISSVVLVEKDRSYIKSEAVLRIMEYLNLPFPQLAAFLKIAPLFVRDFAYDNIADNRYVVFGRSETESCEIL